MVSAQELAKHLQSFWPSKFKAECPSGFSGTQFRNHRDRDTSLPAPGLPSFHSPSLRCLIHSDTSPPSLLSTGFPDPAICQTTGVAPAPPHQALQLHCPRPSETPSPADQVLLPTSLSSQWSNQSPRPGVQPPLPLDLVTLSSTEVPTSIPPQLTDLPALCHASCRSPPTLNLPGVFHLPQPHARHKEWHLSPHLQHLLALLQTPH